MDNVRPVVSFNSVEEFWGCVSSSLSLFCDSSLLSSWFSTTQSLQQHRCSFSASSQSQLLPLQGSTSPPFSRLLSKLELTFFSDLNPQENIIPAWEDDANHDGGKWSVQVPKDKSKATIDQMWLFTVRLSFSLPFFIFNPSS